MSHRTRAGRALALLATVVLAAGCTGAPASPSFGSPNAPAIQSIRVVGATTFTVADHGQMRAIVLFSDGTEQDVTAQAAWSSSARVMTIDARGFATALGAGQSTVSATFNSVTGTLNIVVNEWSGP